MLAGSADGELSGVGLDPVGSVGFKASGLLLQSDSHERRSSGSHARMRDMMPLPLDWLRRCRTTGGILGLAVLAPLASLAAQVDAELAEQYFAEARALCEQERARLWGVPLYGPMVFADPATRTIATNQPAPKEPRPAVLGYANAALEWGGVRWSTLVWPMIPAHDERARARLLVHESFHRVQPGLGLLIQAVPGTNDHLDSLEGRYWMLLEWRALAAALRVSRAEQKSALGDALAFRAARRARFPGAAASERAVEINEGLAQYTATVVVAETPRAAAEDAIEQLQDAARQAGLVATFAYASGAAYGVLLDQWSPGWIGRITRDDDLGKLLGAAAEVQPATDAAAAGERHGGPALRAAEEQREAEHQVRLAELRKRFVDGPVLVVPRGRNASFVTTGVTAIPGAGTVMPSFRVQGEWGSIEAAAVLRSLDGQKLSVPGPVERDEDGSTLSGEGWKVTLAAGWTVRPGTREGDLHVVRERGEGR